MEGCDALGLPLWTREIPRVLFVVAVCSTILEEIGHETFQSHLMFLALGLAPPVSFRGEWH